MYNFAILEQAIGFGFLKKKYYTFGEKKLADFFLYS